MFECKGDYAAAIERMRRASADGAALFGAIHHEASPSHHCWQNERQPVLRSSRPDLLLCSAARAPIEHALVNSTRSKATPPHHHLPQSCRLLRDSVPRERREHHRAFRAPY